MSAAANKRLHAAGAAEDQHAFDIQLILAECSEIPTGPQRNLRAADIGAIMDDVVERQE